MSMCDCGMGIVEGKMIAVEPASEVDVFGIHKESWVEKAGFPERVSAQEHEASVMVWGIDNSVWVASGEVIPFSTFFQHGFWQECPHEHVKGGGEWVNDVLRGAVGVYCVGNKLGAFWVGAHEA